MSNQYIFNGILEEEEQPESFIAKGKEETLYRLYKALYGLKQTPRACYSQIDDYLLGLDFEKKTFIIHIVFVC